MSKNQISDIVQSATRQIVTNTQTLIDSASGRMPGADTVCITCNREETYCAKEDYEATKTTNAAVRADMKSKLKEAIAQLKVKPEVPADTSE